MYFYVYVLDGCYLEVRAIIRQCVFTSPDVKALVLSFCVRRSQFTFFKEPILVEMFIRWSTRYHCFFWSEIPISTIVIRVRKTIILIEIVEIHHRKSLMWTASLKRMVVVWFDFIIHCIYNVHTGIYKLFWGDMKWEPSFASGLESGEGRNMVSGLENCGGWGGGVSCREGRISGVM